MDKLIVILVVVVIGLIAINVWNLLTLKQILRRPLRNDKLNDEKYFELKYKQEFQVALFTVLFAIIGFLGYNSFDNLKTTLKESIDEKLDTAEKRMADVSTKAENISRTFSEQADSNNRDIEKFKNELRDMELKQGKLRQSSKYSQLEFSNLVQRVKEMNSKNLLKLNYYIVDSLTYDLRLIEKAQKESDVFKTFYFKDLKTSNGDKLPAFATPPFIITTSNEAFTVNIKDVTTEYFRAVIYMPIGDLTNVYFKIFISELSK